MSPRRLLPSSSRRCEECRVFGASRAPAVGAGHTLLELLVAISLFGLTSAVGLQSLQKSNHNAALSRLQTGAATSAQHYLDLFLSERPFNPQLGQIPPNLELGSRNIGTPDEPTVGIFVDPLHPPASVFGWVTVEIADPSASVDGEPLHVYRARVRASYKYRGKTHHVELSALRAPDS